MDLDEADILEIPSWSRKGHPVSRWIDYIPKSYTGEVRDITDNGFWTLSSFIEGYGIHQLLDEDTDQYWQSDGPQPHVITVEFPKKEDILFVLLYLDYKTDESYTPSK
ncbi:unnamed protein product [Gongylonema pulchrum]|uniref:Anaphase-promoting complex subunit 10 n=1 Tax=Gongylonema pulchrum TaxID=637853 RepID=A0A183DXU2_9BILA|nr:unnamed protein product [Gongylonema pulchrum]